jgi:hypothetical protein
MKSGNLNFLEPSWPLQACNGTALPFFHLTRGCTEQQLVGQYCTLYSHTYSLHNEACSNSDKLFVSSGWAENKRLEGKRENSVTT